MAQEKNPCACGGIAALVIVVLTILSMMGKIAGSWVSIVVLILAILITLGSFAGGCICTKLCKPKEGESCCQPPSQDQ